ncbi:hypothetical protein CR513_21108, partial [Mucuna pruriens]
MAYQNYNYGWRCSSDEYQVYDPPVEATHPRHHHHHHNKGHVAFRTNYEDQVVQGREQEQRQESTRFGNHKAFKSVDQEAEAFILYEHNRMELARLKSTRGALCAFLSYMTPYHAICYDAICINY